MKRKTPTKYQSVRDALETSIRSGELRSGDRLPAEEAIAQRYGVSLMTARRAVSDLVSTDLLERRARFGTFVRRSTHERLSKATITFITTAYEGWGRNAFVSSGLLLAEERGLNANIVSLAAGEQNSAVRSLQSGHMAVIMLDEVIPSSSLSHAIRASKDRIVALHPLLSDFGVCSILSDVVDNFRIALDHLHSQGHRHIAVATQAPYAEDDNTHSMFWQRAYQRAIESHELSVHRIPVKAPLFTSPASRAYESVTEYMRAHPRTTAIVSTGDEIAIGALAACRDLGRPVPDSISLVNIGDSSLMQFAQPTITCVDLKIDLQVRLAVDILTGTASRSPTDDPTIWTKSDLVMRSSVAPAPMADACSEDRQQTAIIK